MITRSVLITGCNRGLGLEMVRQLVASESPPQIVIATCRKPESATELQALAAEYKNLKIIKFDMVQYSDLPRVAAEVKEAVGSSGLNLLINNAGILEKCPGRAFGIPLSSLTPETFNSVMETNVTAPLMLTKELLPLLVTAAVAGVADGGADGEVLGVSRAAVINVSSALGSMGDFLGKGDVYGYRASKAALNMVTKTLWEDFKEQGMLVVAIHPGWVQTDMGTSDAPLTPHEAVAKVLHLLPKLKREHCGFMVSSVGDVLKW